MVENGSLDVQIKMVNCEFFFFYLMVCFYMEKQALFTEMNTERVWHSTFTPMGFGYNY